jgi:4-hydroxy-2-oxoheptanedioate aldolase
MTLRDLWESDQATLGGWCAIPDPFCTELMGAVGFDWVCIDMQHGMVGYQQMVGMLQSLAITRTPGIVRVAENSPAEIMRALDAGAAGVIVPMINSPTAAATAAGACRYPKEGYRSWGPIRAAMHNPDYSVESANRAVICAVMIESAEAIDNLDAILRVPGIDAVFIGPNDLSISNGLHPDLTASHPLNRRQIMTILDQCQRHGTVAGIFCGSTAMSITWWNEGFRMLALQKDSVFVQSAAKQMLLEVRGGRGELMTPVSTKK